MFGTLQTNVWVSLFAVLGEEWDSEWSRIVVALMLLSIIAHCLHVWRQIAATVQAFSTLDIAALEGGTVAAIPSRDLSHVCVHSASAI